MRHLYNATTGEAMSPGLRDRIGIKLRAWFCAWIVPCLLLHSPGLVRAQFEYTNDNGSITITRYRGTNEVVEIPGYIDELPVAGIDQNVFSMDFAPSLVRVIIPATVTRIGTDTFRYCSSLIDIVVDESNSTYRSMDGVLFDESGEVLIRFPRARGGGYSVSPGVLHLGDSAFRDCDELTSISLPIGITGIGNGALSNCSRLSSITLPHGLSAIGDMAFRGCSSLTEIAIPQTVSVIGAQAFENCRSLQHVSIPDGVGVIDRLTFGGCVRLASVELPGSLESIELAAFYYCRNLSDMSIPDGVIGIETWAFMGCDNLVNLTIPDSVRTIGSSAFAECGQLARVHLGSGLETLGEEAFEFCRNLSEIQVSEANTWFSSIDGVLFDKSQRTLLAYPPSREAVHYTIPQGVTTIGVGAFRLCSSLIGIVFPAGVANIGDRAFQHCTGLIHVELPDGVTSIGLEAFHACRNLKSVALPESIVSIGAGAFTTYVHNMNMEIGGYTVRLEFVGANSPDLHGMYFDGDAPSDSTILTFASLEPDAIVYYLPGTSGWGPTFAGLQTRLWDPQVVLDADFGGQEGTFAFTIFGADGMTVVVEACDDLASSSWEEVQTLKLTGGSASYSEPDWVVHPGRFYRFRTP